MKNKLLTLLLFIIIMITGVNAQVIEQVSANAKNDFTLAPLRCTTSATTSQTNVSCNGSNNGTASVVASGGPTPYTYMWLPEGGTEATASGLTAGTYSCTITDANNCKLIKTFTITEPNALTATATHTDVNCNGGNNGAASVTVSGGAGAYNYAWLPTGGNASAATDLTAGNYTCVITDANNCKLEKVFTIIEPDATISNTTKNDVTCNGLSNGSAAVEVTEGYGPYTYEWLTLNNKTYEISNLPAGSYTCIITDSRACTSTEAVTITEPEKLTGTISQTNAKCNGHGTGAADIAAAGGTAPYTYLWSLGAYTTTAITDLQAGSYTCIITDANSCTYAETIIITEPEKLTAVTTQSNVTCNGGSLGVAGISVLGGSSPYAYSWSDVPNTTPILTGLPAGTYTCVVTDAHSCTLTKVVAITEAAAITATVVKTDVTCAGGNSGSINVTASDGFGAYTYLWSPGAGTASAISDLAAGGYTCVVTDAHSCTLTKVVTITQPAAITAMVTKTDVACAGGNTGSINVAASGGVGPYTYLWSEEVATTPTVSDLKAGTYTCIITDASSCTLAETVTITAPLALSAKLITTVKPGCGQSNGGVTIEANGGNLPYMYSWNTGATEAVLTGVPAGTYTCTIKDNNACTLSATFTVTNPDAPVVSLNLFKDTVCFKSAPLTLSGGSPASGNYSGASVNSGSFTPANATIGWNVISYFYTGPDNCGGMANDSIYVKTCASSTVLPIYAVKEILHLYPNPASDVLHVSFESSGTRFITVKVINVNGVVISNTAVPNFTGNYSQALALSDYSKGIYFVQIITESNVIVKRVMIN